MRFEVLKALIVKKNPSWNMTPCLYASETQGICSDDGRNTFLPSVSSYLRLHSVNPFYFYIKDQRNVLNCMRIGLYFHKVY